MKLTELLINQKITVQLLWGEQVIEFSSNVIEHDDSAVYVSPYLHHGSELELNVSQTKGVICNIFTNNPNTRQRISWRNVELSTVKNDGKMLYCLKTKGFNFVANLDDRRQHDRMVINVNAQVFDGTSKEGVNVIVHDISDVGISFYASKSFEPQVHQLVILFTDAIDGKEFQMRVECTIVRMTTKAGNRFVGCKITNANKDYQFYGSVIKSKDKDKHKLNMMEQIRREASIDKDA